MVRFLRNNKKIYENSARKNKNININSKGIIVGSLEENNSKIISLARDSNTNKNTAVIGSVGTGKTRNFVIPNIIQSINNGDSLVITNFRNELHSKMAKNLEDTDYEVKVLDLSDILYKMQPEEYRLEDKLEYLLAQENFSLKSKSRKYAYFIQTGGIENIYNNEKAKLLAGKIISYLLEKALNKSIDSESNNINFILDDFEFIGRIPMLFLFKNKRITVNIIFRSIRQFKEIYGKEECISILDNCDNFVCFGDTDAETINLVNRLRIKDDEELNLNYIKKNEAVLILRNGTAVKVKKINLDIIINTKTLK